MNINTAYTPSISARQNLQPSPTSRPSTEVAQPTASESFERTSKSETPALLKAGKWVLAGAAAAGAGALGWYAGTNTGFAAGAAAALIGGVTGAVGLGSIGLISDVASLGGSKTATLGATGAIIGGAVGSATTLLGGNPIVGGAMALVGGVIGFGAAAASTNLLAK